MTTRILVVAPRSGQPIDGRLGAAARAAGLSGTSVGDAQVYSDAPSLPFERAPGCVVGDIFARKGAGYTTLPASTCLAIEGSDGRFAAEHCWGRYLAFWRDRASGVLTVFREPSGAIPLFHLRRETDDLLFSRPDLAVALGLLSPTIDWTSVAHELVYPQLPNRRTCLVGVEEVLPGERLRLNAAVPARDQLWSPWRFAMRAREDGDPDRGADALRAIVQESVARLSEPFGHVRLELSGGLDSSILALCLAAAGRPWSGINLFTDAPGGDERSYARGVADATQATLEEVRICPGDLDLLPAPARLRVRPSGLSMLSSLDRLLGDRALEAGADAMLSGTGGDNVFCFLVSGVPIADAWRTGGRARTGAAIRNLTQLTRHSYWHLIRHALHVALRDRLAPGRWQRDCRLLARELSPPMFGHPWLERPLRGLAGSRAHITLLMRARAVLDSYDRADRLPLLFPLIAQPVMEFCLTVPSWRWIDGGRDRALAREAFDAMLPQAIQQRRSKGRLESLLAPAFDRDRLRVRALLLDGLLARQGLLDRPAIEQVTGRDSSSEDPLYVRALELADAELWARGVTVCA